MNITILSEPDSWLRSHLEGLSGELRRRGHQVRLAWTVGELGSGDLAFLLACGRVLSTGELAGHRHNLVVHASALPQGRGWSPMTWQILEGRSVIPIVLFEAAPVVDRGAIYLRRDMHFRGDELVDELRAETARRTVELCLGFVDGYPSVLAGAEAPSGPGSTYRRRRAEDSRLDPQRSLAEQFDLLRVVDNDRYPAFFELRGRRYRLRIDAMEG